MPVQLSDAPAPGLLIACVLLLIAVRGTAGPIEELPAGHWLEIPGSQLEAVFPETRPPGNTGPRSVMDAWSGGAYDSDRDRLLVWGGGHCDYAGNELYAFDLPSLRWLRLTEPTPAEQVRQNRSYYADGQPAARHTYDMLSYLPNVGKLMSAGGSGYFCGSSAGFDRSTDLFDFASGRWERGADHPAIGSSIGRVSAFDPVTGYVWVHGAQQGGRLASYDPMADRWQTHGSSRFFAIYGTAAIDSRRHQLLVVGGYGGEARILMWKLRRPGRPRVPRTSGPNDLERGAAVGLAYTPVADRYVGWQGGAAVYLLNPDTWQWTKVEPAPGNVVVPTEANRNGTYGRFRYAPNYDVFVLVNRTRDNVFVFRLPEISQESDEGR